MNKNNWNTILYIIVIVVIMGVFIRLLPYLLICGVTIWGIVKIYKFFNRKPNKFNDTKRSNHNYDYKVEENTEDVNEVIDVDYKDV